MILTSLPASSFYTTDEADGKGLGRCRCSVAYGTPVANLGTPAHTLQSLMGHSSIETTLKFYVQDSDENKKKAVDGLDRLMEEE